MIHGWQWTTYVTLLEIPPRAAARFLKADAYTTWRHRRATQPT